MSRHFQNVIEKLIRQRDALLAIAVEAANAIGEQVESVRGPLEDECSKQNRNLARKIRRVIKKCQEVPDAR